MKLWLDDVRLPPAGYSKWVKTADECIEELKTGKYTHVSLDHDLADEHYHGNKPAREAYKEKTGMDVVLWMVENNVFPAECRVHTMNPIGRHNMMTAFQKWAPESTRAWASLPSDSPGVLRRPWEQ